MVHFQKALKPRQLATLLIVIIHLLVPQIGAAKTSYICHLLKTEDKMYRLNTLGSLVENGIIKFGQEGLTTEKMSTEANEALVDFSIFIGDDGIVYYRDKQNSLDNSLVGVILGASNKENLEAHDAKGTQNQKEKTDFSCTEEPFFVLFHLKPKLGQMLCSRFDIADVDIKDFILLGKKISMQAHNGADPDVAKLGDSNTMCDLTIEIDTKYINNDKYGSIETETQANGASPARETQKNVSSSNLDKQNMIETLAKENQEKIVSEVFDTSKIKNPPVKEVQEGTTSQVIDKNIVLLSHVNHVQDNKSEVVDKKTAAGPSVKNTKQTPPLKESVPYKVQETHVQTNQGNLAPSETDKKALAEHLEEKSPSTDPRLVPNDKLGLKVGLTAIGSDTSQKNNKPNGNITPIKTIANINTTKPVGNTSPQITTLGGTSANNLNAREMMKNNLKNNISNIYDVKTGTFVESKTIDVKSGEGTSQIKGISLNKSKSSGLLDDASNTKTSQNSLLNTAIDFNSSLGNKAFGPHVHKPGEKSYKQNHHEQNVGVVIKNNPVVTKPLSEMTDDEMNKILIKKKPIRHDAFIDVRSNPSKTLPGQTHQEAVGTNISTKQTEKSKPSNFDLAKPKTDSVELKTEIMTTPVLVKPTLKTNNNIQPHGYGVGVILQNIGEKTNGNNAIKTNIEAFKEDPAITRNTKINLRTIPAPNVVTLKSKKVESPVTADGLSKVRVIVAAKKINKKNTNAKVSKNQNKAQKYIDVYSNPGDAMDFLTNVKGFDDNAMQNEYGISVYDSGSSEGGLVDDLGDGEDYGYNNDSEDEFDESMSHQDDNDDHIQEEDNNQLGQEPQENDHTETKGKIGFDEVKKILIDNQREPHSIQSPVKKTSIVKENIVGASKVGSKDKLINYNDVKRQTIRKVANKDASHNQESSHAIQGNEETIAIKSNKTVYSGRTAFNQQMDKVVANKTVPAKVQEKIQTPIDQKKTQLKPVNKNNLQGIDTSLAHESGDISPTKLTQREVHQSDITKKTNKTAGNQVQGKQTNIIEEAAQDLNSTRAIVDNSVHNASLSRLGANSQQQISPVHEDNTNQTAKPPNKIINV